MDLQVRKIQFVQEFLILDSEQIMDVLENVLKSEKKKLYKSQPKPFTLAEFNQMIDQAESDVANNRMRTIHELKTEIQSWK
jgi:hypothetical protein